MGDAFIPYRWDEVWGRNWGCVIASHTLTRHAPTVRPNASSKPLFASGLMSATTPTPKNAISNFPPGCTTTTSPVPMVASVTLHPSAALLPGVQPLEGSQPGGWPTFAPQWRLPHPSRFSKGEHHGPRHLGSFITYKRRTGGPDHRRKCSSTSL